MRQKQQLTMLDKQTGCRNFRKHWTIARETMMYKCSYIKCGKLQQCLMIRTNEKWLDDDKASELSLKRKEYTKDKQTASCSDSTFVSNFRRNEFEMTFLETISVIVGKNNFNDVLKCWCFCDHQKNWNAFITDNFDLLYF